MSVERMLNDLATMGQSDFDKAKSNPDDFVVEYDLPDHVSEAAKKSLGSGEEHHLVDALKSHDPGQYSDSTTVNII